MTNTDEAALYDVMQGVATITLNRPENRNALSIEMVNCVGDHFQTAQNDDAVRVILFTNNGNTFCAGADLKANQPGVPQPAARHSFVQILDDIIESPKPVWVGLPGTALEEASVLQRCLTSLSLRMTSSWASPRFA